VESVLIATLVLRWIFATVLRRRALSWTLAFVIALAGVSYITLQVSRSRSFQFFDHMILPRPTAERIVALTFDDGPSARFTPEVLGILEREHARGTFFVIGGELKKEMAVGRMIASSGNEIGNHSFSHNRMVFKTGRWIAHEIETTDALIRQTGYGGPVLFRSPYGKRLLSLPLYLARHDRWNVFWDIEPESDPRVARSSDAIAGHVLSRVKPGSIVLLHPNYSTGANARKALPLIIRELRKRGYEFVTVSEMLERRGARAGTRNRQD
jgi:peptidoglycan/xylan/chitin deacetylase (PgdA/CDA1 family)